MHHKSWWQKSKGTRWDLLFFDCLGIEYIPQNILDKIKYKSITHSILCYFDDFIICRFYCVTLIEYINVEETFLDYTGLFSGIVKPCTHLQPVPSISTHSPHLHPPPSTSTPLSSAHFSLYPILYKNLNVKWTKIFHLIRQFPLI